MEQALRLAPAIAEVIEVPLTVTEIIQLADINVPIEHITWPRVVLSSDGWICARHCKAPHSQSCSRCRARNTHNAAWRELGSKSMSLDRSRCRSSSRSPARRVGSIDAATSPSIASAIAAAAAASNGYTRRALVSFRERLQCSLTMLNLYGGGATVRWKVCADSVKKNPGKPWVALKAGQQLEVYDMERKVLVSKHKTSFPVIFWTWIGASVIALVSDDAVYHWDLAHGSDASSAQRRLFARHSRLDNAEIVSYVADDAHRWCALLGLIENDGAVQGVVQLYSTDERLSQPIDAHAVSFATYTFDGNAHPSTLLCVALRACGRSGKVHVVELGPHVKGNGALTTYSETIKFTANTSKYDFPVATEVSSSQRLVYIVTKYGHLFLCELETGMFLCQIQMSRDVIFATLLNSETQGVIGISRNGQVLLVDVKKEEIVEYIKKVLKKPKIASRMETYINT